MALWGTSYGGWLAGLTVCRDARIAAVVLAVPSVRTNKVLPDLILWPRIRHAMQAQCVEAGMLDTTPLNLTLSRPAIPRENILLIEAIYDLFAPKEPIEELWQAWGRPDIWRLPCGHMTWVCTSDLTGRVLRWLSPRLNAHAVR